VSTRSMAGRNVFQHGHGGIVFGTIVVDFDHFSRRGGGGGTNGSGQCLFSSRGSCRILGATGSFGVIMIIDILLHNQGRSQFQCGQQVLRRRSIQQGRVVRIGLIPQSLGFGSRLVVVVVVVVVLARVVVVATTTGPEGALIEFGRVHLQSHNFDKHAHQGLHFFFRAGHIIVVGVGVVTAAVVVVVVGFEFVVAVAGGTVAVTVVVCGSRSSIVQ